MDKFAKSHLTNEEKEINCVENCMERIKLHLHRGEINEAMSWSKDVEKSLERLKEIHFNKSETFKA